LLRPPPILSLLLLPPLLLPLVLPAAPLLPPSSLEVAAALRSWQVCL
jgi:hypothetical protein